MAPTIGVNLRVTGHCNQGGRKYMEDAFVVAYQQTEDEKDLEYAYFGIFDGHGGREAALYAKEHLMDHIVNQKNFWSDEDNLVLKAIRDGFITTHLAMWKEVGKWPKTVSGLPSTSGTTSSVAFIRRGKMYIGHVGDSKIVLGYQEPGSDLWMPQSLTKDHKPESPLEKKRIYSVGGLVMNKAGVERVVWNRPRLGHKGPIRRSTHFDQIPFLAVARSLGDLWSYNYLRREFIVSPEPDISVITLDPKRDRCVILASDGLWNMVTTWDAVRIVQDAEEENEKLILEGGGPTGVGKPANNPSKLLVDRALNHWIQLKMRADNTSVVTVLLDPPGPPKSEVLLRQKVMQKLRPRDDQPETEINSVNCSQDAGEAKLQKKLSSEFGNFKGSEEASSFISKEKKKVGNLTEPRSYSLPKPVVLSPQRVIVKRTVSRDDKSPVILPHFLDDVGNRSPGVFRQNCYNRTLPGTAVNHSNDPPVQRTDQQKNCNSDPVLNENMRNTVSDLCHAAKEDLSVNKIKHSSSERTSVGSEMNNRNIAKYAENSSCMGNEPNKECGRSHLSEVKNIVKAENFDKRTSECSRPILKPDENKEKIWENELNNQRLITESSSVSGMKRKLQEDSCTDESLLPVKRLRLHQGSSWMTDSFSSCRVLASRDMMDLPHNTRARHRIRKMKV